MSIQDVLAELRKTYIEALPGRADTIERMWSDRRYSDVETEFHKLKGTGKTYGIPEISQVGEITERLCECGTTSAEESVPAALKLLRKIYDARSKGLPWSLENDPDFLYLSELAREIHETTSGTKKR